MPPPSVAVIVPVLNEARTIAHFLRALEAAEPDEIIVVDGGSEDGTVAVVRRHANVAVLWTWFIIQPLYSLGVSPRRLGRIYRVVR